MRTFLTLLFAAVLLPLALQGQREKFTLDEIEIIEKKWPDVTRTKSGLRTQLLSPGLGGTPKSGDEVSVIYRGTLFDGTVFDQSKDANTPFTFRLDRQQVIPGWDEGLKLMRVGERRLFIVPAELAYGSRGRPPSILSSAPLVFEVKLLSIKPFDVPKTESSAPEKK